MSSQLADVDGFAQVRATASVRDGREWINRIVLTEFAA
jgi:hypothetical protein